MASVVFAIMFYHMGNMAMMTIALSAAGAIIPFFLHNVFGYDTRMFIGDSGTLVVGTMMSMFVISILEANVSSTSMMLKGVGLIPFTIAVLSIPVFDTVRVMSTRILHKKSPFNPDKTHLHHMFIDLGFSHVGTTISILSLNFMVVVLWYISYLIGAPEELQFFIVIAMGLSITVVFYTFAEKQLKNNGRSLRTLKRISKALNIEKKGMWLKVQELIDKL